MNIALAIRSLHPTASFRIDGEDFESLEWLSSDIPAPEKSVVESEVARLQAEYEAMQYARSRAKAYPSIGDQLDALWKGGDAAAEMLAKVQAVKAKYPKPTE